MANCTGKMSTWINGNGSSGISVKKSRFTARCEGAFIPAVIIAAEVGYRFG